MSFIVPLAQYRVYDCLSPFLLIARQPYFRKYGLVWFIWSDFIPKGIATIAFLNLMNSRANQRQGSSDVKPSWASNVNELELERSNYDVVGILYSFSYILTES